MTDILLGPDSSSGKQGQWHLMRSGATHVDLLASVRNGQGGTTVFEYTPSSHYNNCQPALKIDPPLRLVLG
jgi:hypothetical protein